MPTPPATFRRPIAPLLARPARLLLPLAALLLAVGLFAGQARAQATPAPAAPAAAAAGANGAAPATEDVPGNVVSLMIKNIDPISIIILLLSVLAITLIIQAFLRVRRSVILPEDSTATIEEMIQNRKFKDLIQFTEEDDSFVSASLNPALKQAPNFAGMKEAMETAVGERMAEEFRKLEVINILANVGPLLGLLGTVLGIMQAFLKMQQGGGAANPASLAGGISTALGTTLLGLCLAIPCLVAYGILRTKADRLTNEGALQAEEFLQMMKPEGGKSRPSSSSSTAASSAASSSRAAAPAPGAARAASPAPKPSKTAVPAQ